MALSSLKSHTQIIIMIHQNHSLMEVLGKMILFSSIYTICHGYWLLSGGLRGPQRALGGNWCQRQWFSFTCRSHKGLRLLLWQYLPSLSKFSALFIFNIYPYCITVLCFVRRFPNNWHQGVRDVIAVDELFDCIPAINRFKCFQFLRRKKQKMAFDIFTLKLRF